MTDRLSLLLGHPSSVSTLLLSLDIHNQQVYLAWCTQAAWLLMMVDPGGWWTSPECFSNGTPWSRLSSRNPERLTSTSWGNEICILWQCPLGKKYVGNGWFRMVLWLMMVDFMFACWLVTKFDWNFLFKGLLRPKASESRQLSLRHHFLGAKLEFSFKSLCNLVGKKLIIPPTDYGIIFARRAWWTASWKMLG